MSYASQQNMVDRFGEPELIALTDRAGTGELDEAALAVLATTFADADAEIDGYLAGRYAIPLTVVPPIIVRIACDLTRYHLTGALARDNQVIHDRYRDVVRLLEAISKGTVQLGLTEQHEAAPQGGGPTVSAPERVFTADTLKDFAP